MYCLLLSDGLICSAHARAMASVPVPCATLIPHYTCLLHSAFGAREESKACAAAGSHILSTAPARDSRSEAAGFKGNRQRGWLPAAPNDSAFSQLQRQESHSLLSFSIHVATCTSRDREPPARGGFRNSPAAILAARRASIRWPPGESGRHPPRRANEHSQIGHGLQAQKTGRSECEGHQTYLCLRRSDRVFPGSSQSSPKRPVSDGVRTRPRCIAFNKGLRCSKAATALHSCQQMPIPSRYAVQLC